MSRGFTALKYKITSLCYKIIDVKLHVSVDRGENDELTTGVEMTKCYFNLNETT